MRADGADQRLFFRPLQDVVVLDDAADGLQVDEALLGDAFHALRREAGLSLGDLYVRGREHEDLYQLAEALTEWDERVNVWRFRHYKVVSRIIGDSVVGTQGTPVELLGSLIKKSLYPELWRARNEITARSNEED